METFCHNGKIVYNLITMPCGFQSQDDKIPTPTIMN